MRQNLMLATMALAMAACGPSGNTPWDQNHDGLITPCEGLNPQTCDATPGCDRAPVVCTMECRDDGHGGCLPCAGADLCRPLPPPPVLDCSRLPAALCAVTPRCELVQQTVCSGSGVADPASPVDPTTPPQPRCGNETCTTTEACVNRAPASCESLSNDVCLSQPGCALEGSGAVCEIACDPDNGSCPPCATPQLRCVTVHPTDTCADRDPSVCSMDGRCVLEQGPLCDVFCAPGSACPPCATPSLRCVPAPVPDVCGARDESSCAVDGLCVLEQGGACDAACDPNGNCAPCRYAGPRCVPAPPPDLCGARDENSCAVDGLCVLEQGPLCAALCDPNGLCPPCANPSPRCVPAPPVDECAGRDLASCDFDGRCEVMAWACPAICIDDGHGGCQPCNAPPSACVPVNPPSRCEGLDRTTCAAVGCTVLERGIACTQDCRDDGHGGCLPCPDFVCTDGSGSGGTGGGTPPPSPRP